MKPTKLQKELLKELYKKAHLGVCDGDTLIWGFTPDEWRRIIGDKKGG